MFRTARQSAFVVLGVVALLGVASATINAQTLLAQTLPAGSEMSVRTMTRVVGRESSRGALVRMMLMVPLADGARVLLAPRTVLEGVIIDAGTEHTEGARRFVQLRLTSVFTVDGRRIPIDAVVSGVDNSRDTVDIDGRIVGPRKASLLRSRADWAAVALGTLNPIAATIYLAALRAERDERHREIVFESGTDMKLRLRADVALSAQSDWSPPPSVPDSGAGLLYMLNRTPLRARALGGRIVGDFVSLVLLGSDTSLQAAFRAAGWDAPDRMSTRSDFGTFLKAAEGAGYTHQPVSQQLLFGVRRTSYFSVSLTPSPRGTMCGSGAPRTSIWGNRCGQPPARMTSAWSSARYTAASRTARRPPSILNATRS